MSTPVRNKQPTQHPWWCARDGIAAVYLLLLCLPRRCLCFRTHSIFAHHDTGNPLDGGGVSCGDEVDVPLWRAG